MIWPKMYGDTYTCDDLLTFIKEKCEEFQQSKYCSFEEFVDDRYKTRKGVLEHPGVYVIYEGNSPIYAGSAGRGKHSLRFRI